MARGHPTGRGRCLAGPAGPQEALCPPPPPAVAYGVIAGLVSYVAIHLPFWLGDYVRKRWWPSGDVAASPRMQRMRRRWAAGGLAAVGLKALDTRWIGWWDQHGQGRHAQCRWGTTPDWWWALSSPSCPPCPRRSKAGYHVRKTFGPPADPPSRAESYVGGYDDSYHTQAGGGGPVMQPHLPTSPEQVACSLRAPQQSLLDVARSVLGHTEEHEGWKVPRRTCNVDPLCCCAAG